MFSKENIFQVAIYIPMTDEFYEEWFMPEIPFRECLIELLNLDEEVETNE
jgi:hypothetical protein